MIVKFPVRDEALDEMMYALDKAFSAIAELSASLDEIEAKALNLQEAFDSRVQALAHRLGGLEHVPLEYLLYTSLDEQIVDVMEKMQWTETT